VLAALAERPSGEIKGWFRDQCLNARRGACRGRTFRQLAKQQESFHEPDGPSQHRAVGCGRSLVQGRADLFQRAALIAIPTYGPARWLQPPWQCQSNDFARLQKSKFILVGLECANNLSKTSVTGTCICGGERGKSLAFDLARL